MQILCENVTSSCTFPCTHTEKLEREKSVRTLNSPRGFATSFRVVFAASPLARARSLTNRQLRRLGLLKFFVVPNKFRGENATFKAWTGARREKPMVWISSRRGGKASFFRPLYLFALAYECANKRPIGRSVKGLFCLNGWHF